MIDAGQIISYIDLDASKFNASVKGVIASLKDITNRALPASTRIKGLGDSLQGLGRQASIASAAIAAVGTAAVVSFTKYDDAIRQVWATMNATAEEQRALDELARKSALGSTQTINQVATAMDALAAAGYDVEKSQSALPTVMLVAQAGNLDMARATDILTGSMTALGIEIEKMPEYADQISGAAQSSNASIAEMGDAILSVGSYARQLAGGTIELTTGLGVLADVMIKGSEGGTALRNIIRALASPEEGAAKVLKSLRVSAYDATGAFRPLNETLADLDAALAKLTPEKRAATMSKIFNAYDLAAAGALMESTKGRWQELSAEIAGSQGSMQKMADTMQGGLGGATRELLANISVLGVEFGENLAPTVEMVADKVGELAGWFAELPEDVQSSIVNVAMFVAAIGPVLIVGGKVISMFGVLAGLISGLGGWIALGLAGVAALAAAMQDLGTSAAEAQDAFMARYGDKSGTAPSETIEKKVNLDVDVTSNAGENVLSAVDQLKGLLKGIDVLTDDERNEILAMIGTDLDPIKSALTAAGLTEGQAEAVQAEIDAATSNIRGKLAAMKFLDEDTRLKILGMVGEDRATLAKELKKLELTPEESEEVIAAVLLVEGNLRKKLGEMDVLSQTEINQIIKMIGDDKALIIRQLKTMGLTDAEALEVANAINLASDGLKGGVTSLFDKIYQALTDGEPDTEAQTKALQTEVQTYYDDLIGKINLNTETQLANLNSQLENGFITAEQYQTRADEITAKNGALIASVQQTCTDTLTYVADMSGKSTTEVENSLTKIEKLKQKALEEAAAIAELAEQAASAEGNTAQGLVKSGAKVDQETVNLAFDTAYNRKQVDTYGAEQASKTKQAELGQGYVAAYEAAQKEGASPEELKALTDNYNAAMAAELASLETKKAEFQAAYDQTIAELTQGLMESNPLIAEGIRNATKNLNVYEEVSAALTELVNGTPPSDINLSDTAKQLIRDWFSIDFDNTQWQEGLFDFGKLDMKKVLADAKEALFKEIDQFINPDEDDPLAPDLGVFGQTFAKQIQDGMIKVLENPEALPGEGGFDFAKAFLKFFSGNGGVESTKEEVSKYGKDVGSSLPEGAALGIAENDDQVADAAETMMGDAVTAAEDKVDSNSPSEVFRAIGRSMPDGAALGVNDNASSVASAVASMASRAIGALDGMAVSGVLAGQDAIRGLINGAESKRESLINKFKSLAKAAIQAAKDELGIASPSKVFAAIGTNVVSSMADSIDRNRHIVEASMSRLVALSPTQITGAGKTYQTTSNVVNNYNDAPITVTLPNATVRSDNDIIDITRRTQRVIRDLKYGLGVRRR